MQLKQLCVFFFTLTFLPNVMQNVAGILNSFWNWNSKLTNSDQHTLVSASWLRRYSALPAARCLWAAKPPPISKTISNKLSFVLLDKSWSSLLQLLVCRKRDLMYFVKISCHSATCKHHMTSNTRVRKWKMFKDIQRNNTKILATALLQHADSQPDTLTRSPTNNAAT